MFSGSLDKLGQLVYFASKTFLMKNLLVPFKLILLATGFAFLLFGCSKEKTVATPNAGRSAATMYFKNGSQVCGQVRTVNFIAGQHILVGNIEVYNSADSIYVTYKTTGDWRMRTLHLFVGKCNQLPVNKSGNPVPGRFPYSKSFGSYCATEFTFRFLKSAFDSCFCVAAHAEVARANGSQAETAWGQGTRFVQKGNWGMYFNVCKQACLDPCAPQPNEGCSHSPISLFDIEGNKYNIWGSSNITIGGFQYNKSEIIEIYELQPTGNDAWKAFIAIAAIKISGNNVSSDASVLCHAAVVEAWLASLGKLSSGNLPPTAPATVQPSLNALVQWVSANECP
jgi:hypothetical protein